jgi:MarR-like DNA-binding transcriptional regulator SgrR of sgrS sRNA
VLASGIASAETPPDYGGELVGSLTGEPASFDPAEARSHSELTVVGLVFDSLYRTASDDEIVPHLAAALPVEDGGKLRIGLRRGLTFHDGTALDAGDVRASLRRLRKTSAAWLVAPIDTIEVAGDDLLLGLRAGADPRDVAVLLAAPQAAITAGGKAPSTKSPIGSGPFQVTEIDKKSRRISLRANDAHVAGRPYLDGLQLRWFETDTGEARQFEDGTLALSARGDVEFPNTGAQPRYRAERSPGPATVLTFVAFGGAHPKVTGDPDFRRALHLAIARGAPKEGIEPSADPVPEALGGSKLAKSMQGGDLAAAREALERAAARVTALSGTARDELSLEVLVDRSRLDDRKAAEKVVRALHKLDLKATITEVDADDLDTEMAGADLWIGQLAAPGVAPQLLWGAAFEAGGDGWARARLEAGELDAAKARKRFEKQLPIVPLYHRALQVHHRTDVRGLVFDKSGRICWAELFLHGKPARSKRKKRR